MEPPAITADFHQPPLQEKLSPNLNEELEKGAGGYINYRDALYKLDSYFFSYFSSNALVDYVNNI